MGMDVAMTSLRTPRGFTLAELVVAIGLSSLVSLALVPVASTIVGHHRLQAATRQLGFEIARARMRAVGQNVFIRLTLVDTTHYGLERSSDGVSYVADGPAIALPQGQEVTAGPTGLPSFNRQGLAPAGTTLLVSGPAGQHTLWISVLGRVRIT